MIHLQLQYFVKNLFPSSKMECPFPEIGRIADVADLENRIIFEIQFSPMSLEEAKNRCRDYESLGYQIVWILHDQTYNQKKISPTERFLRTKTCYFSNMDQSGKGRVYDQHEESLRNWRRIKSTPLTVNLKELSPLPKFHWPRQLQQRALSWPLYTEGDLIDQTLKGKFLFEKWKKRPLFKLKELYLTALQALLAKSSR